jgi:hypothetical protein
MRRTQYRQAGLDWQVRVVGLLLESLPLVDYGHLVTRLLLARVLVWMSVGRGTLSDAPRRMGIKISDETLRSAMIASLPENDHLVSLLNASLTAWLPHARRRKRAFDVAIDLHHQPYYGKKQTGLFRGPPNQGTRLFWSIATMAIVHRGQKLTLAVVPVTTHRMDDVLKALWPQFRKLRLKLRRLLLDRGFYSADVISWLQRRRVSFVMPMIRRGRLPRKGKAGTGTAPFFVRGRRGFGSYTWRLKRRDRRQVTIKVAMVPPVDGRRRPLVFAFSGRLPNLEYCRQIYKKRFGIEASYRQFHQSRGWTTSRDERRRRLLIVLSFALRNVWLLIKPQTPTPRPLQLTYAQFLDIIADTLRLDLTQPQRGPPHTTRTNFGTTDESLGYFRMSLRDTPPRVSERKKPPVAGGFFALA